MRMKGGSRSVMQCVLQHGSLLSGVVLIAAACSRQPVQPEPEPDAEGVVARLGERVVTTHDLLVESRRRPDLTKEQLLESLVTREALLLRAEEKQLSNDPGIRREVDNLLIARLRERDLSGALKAIEVTEEEILDEYRRRINAYTRPGFDRFAMLFLRVDSHASDARKQEIRKRMESARRQVAEQSPAKGFGSLAVTCSDDQVSRYRGGDIGWVASNRSTSRMPDGVLETGRALDMGVVSDVIETAEGLYLVMKTDFRPSTTTSFEKVRGSLRQRLLVEGRRELEERYLKNCVSSAAPRTNHHVMGKFELSVERRPEPTNGVPAFAAGLPGRAE